jgi:hypothetical protein
MTMHTDLVKVADMTMGQEATTTLTTTGREGAITIMILIKPSIHMMEKNVLAIIQPKKHPKLSIITLMERSVVGIMHRSRSNNLKSMFTLMVKSVLEIMHRSKSK